MNYVNTTSTLLEIDLNHNLEKKNFQPSSVTPCHHQLIILRLCQSIISDQTKSTISPKLQSDIVFLPKFQHHFSPSLNSENLTCSNNENKNDLILDYSYLISFFCLETPIFSSIINFDILIKSLTTLNIY